MSLFNLFERIVFYDSENERYDKRKADKDHTRYYIHTIRKILKSREKRNVVTPFKYYLYAKCDIDKICDYFELHGYRAATDGKYQLVLIREGRDSK